MKNEVNNMVNLNDVVTQIKNVESGVNNMIVPMLKDTIKDNNKQNTKLFILFAISLIISAVVTFYSLFLVYKQNIKYQEFLSQFDFESEVFQDLDTKDNSTGVINDGIKINK